MSGTVESLRTAASPATAADAVAIDYAIRSASRADCAATRIRALRNVVDGLSEGGRLLDVLNSCGRGLGMAGSRVAASLDDCAQNASGHAALARATDDPAIAAAQSLLAVLFAGLAWKTFDDWQVDRYLSVERAVRISRAEWLVQQAAQHAKITASARDEEANLAADRAETAVLHEYRSAGLLGGG